MALLAQSGPIASEDRSFLQRRVALFGLVSGSLYLFFLGFRTASAAFGSGLPLLFADPSYWWHLAGALVLLVIWLLCRRGQHGVSYIRAVESLGLLGAAFVFVVMGTYIPLVARPDYILLLALGCALVARALYVPSSGRRTLVLGLAVGAELIPAIYVLFGRIDMAQWKAFEEIANLTPRVVAMNVAANTTAWWVITVVMSTAASQVIYGLRRDVRDAKQLGQYRLEEKIGEGGMGAIYRAKHAMLRRPTAVKLFLPGKSGAVGLRHFEMEVQHTARLSHPNIITIFDYGHSPDGLFYYAMEYLDGRALHEIIEGDGAMNAGRVVHVLKQVAAALVHAHGEGLIHRDIKPANIMLTLPHHHGRVHELVKLLDFGLVREVHGGQIDLSRTDTVSGTPQYMSPEAIRSPSAVDGRSDLYSVGAVAYYLLTGQHVFTGSTVVEVCSHHLHSTPEPLKERVSGPLSAELEALILRCLEKDPAARPASALDFAAALDHLTDIDAWSPEAALTWWTTHGARLRNRSSAGQADTEVLTVEMNPRRGAWN